VPKEGYHCITVPDKTFEALKKKAIEKQASINAVIEELLEAKA
jgi:hypothetical protein